MPARALCALALALCLASPAVAAPPAPSPRDESVDAYITMVIENFAEAMRTGIPILGLPVMDPYNVPADLVLPQLDSPLAALAGNASSVVLSGTSSFTPTYVHLDVPAGTYDMTLEFVGVKVDGAYWTDSLLAYLVPVFGSGRFLLDARGLNVTTRAGVTMTEDGHMQITELSLQLAVQRVLVAFENFLGGGNFGFEVNEALTDFATYAANTAFPLVDAKLMPIIQDLLNGFLQEHTLKEIIMAILFPGSNTQTSQAPYYGF